MRVPRPSLLGRDFRPCQRNTPGPKSQTLSVSRRPLGLDFHHTAPLWRNGESCSSQFWGLSVNPRVTGLRCK
jgi:hypothetical protein